MSSGGSNSAAMVYSLSLATFTSLFSLYLIVAFMRKLRICSKYDDDSNGSANTLRATQISAVASFTTSLLSTLLIWALSIVQLSRNQVFTFDDASFALTYLFSTILLKIWILLSYSFFLLRLIVSFKDSVYAVTNRNVCFHIAFLSLVVAVWVCFMIFMFSSAELSLPMLQFLISIDASLPIIGEIHLCCEFNRRLFQLVLSQRQTVVAANATRTLSEPQTKILRLIRKNTLLSTVQTVSIFMIIVVYVAGSLMSNRGYFVFAVHQQYSAWLMLFDALEAVFACTVNLCLFMAFKVNENVYLALCKPCDAKCAVFYEAMAHRRMNPDSKDKDSPQGSASVASFSVSTRTTSAKAESP